MSLSTEKVALHETLAIVLRQFFSIKKPQDVISGVGMNLPSSQLLTFEPPENKWREGLDMARLTSLAFKYQN